MGVRLRFVIDAVVEEDQYLDKIDQQDVGELLGTTLQNVIMPKYGIITEKVEYSGVHPHHSTPSSNCEGEYALAEDEKHGNN